MVTFLSFFSSGMTADFARSFPSRKWGDQKKNLIFIFFENRSDQFFVNRCLFSPRQLQNVVAGKHFWTVNYPDSPDHMVTDFADEIVVEGN